MELLELLAFPNWKKEKSYRILIMLHLGFVQLSGSKQTDTLNLSILAVHKIG